MSQPNNPPSNPLLGAIYIDQVTNLSWVWTGTYWIQANGSGGYNANVGPGTTLVPGYYADPSPEDWFPFVGNTPPISPRPGQIWVDTTTVPYTSYVWDSNLGQFIALGGGPGADTNSIVSAVRPTNRVNGGQLEVGDIWLDVSGPSSIGKYWNGQDWVIFARDDTHSIYSATEPTYRNDGTPVKTGDLWIDTDTYTIHFNNGASFVPVSAACENVIYGPTEPVTRVNGDPLVPGDLWTDSSTGTFLYYDGSDFITHTPTNTFESSTSPSNKVTGELLEGGEIWYNPDDGFLYAYNSTTGWDKINPDLHCFVGDGDPFFGNPKSLRDDGNLLVEGDQYYDRIGGGFYVYDGTTFVNLISADTHSMTNVGDPNGVLPYSSGLRADNSPALTGDQYIDTSTEIAYYWTGSTWRAFTDDRHSFLGIGVPSITTRPGPIPNMPIKPGDMWIDTSQGKVYYRSNSNTWVEVGTDTHSFYQSTQPLSRPNSASLRNGDLWINSSASNALTVYNSGTGNWDIIGSDTHSFFGAYDPRGGNKTLRDNGTSLLSGDQFFNTLTNTLFIYNAAVGVTEWQVAGPDTHSIRDTTAPGTRPDNTLLQDGDLWVDTDARNAMYVYNKTTNDWELVGPDTHSFVGAGSPVGVKVLRDDTTDLVVGDQYLDTNSNLLYTVTSATPNPIVWTVISGDTHAFIGSGAPTLGPDRPNNGGPLVDGDQYINDTTGALYGWYNNQWNILGSDTHSILGTFDDPQGNVTVRDDGTALQKGDIYINTDSGESWYYTVSNATWNQFGIDTHAIFGVGNPNTPLVTERGPGGPAVKIGDQYVDSGNKTLYWFNGSSWDVLSNDTHSFINPVKPTTINMGANRPNGGTVFQAGDLVIDQSTNILYFWDGGTWIRVDDDTHTLINSGDPNALGVNQRTNTSPLLDGDLYIDSSTNYLWRYISGSTSWVRITSGDSHCFADNGHPATVYGIVNAPDGDPLVEGDQYVDKDNYLLYTFLNGAWEPTSDFYQSFSGTVPPTDPTSGVSAGKRPDQTFLKVGDLYTDTTQGLLYGYYGGTWQVISGDTHSFINNVDPTVAGSGVESGNRPDGTTLKGGDMYVNTATNGIWYYNTQVSNWVNTTVTDRHSFAGNGTPYITTGNPTGALGANPYGTRNLDGVTALLDGDQYWDKATNILYSFNSTEWVAVADDYHALDLGVMTNSFPTTPNVRPDSTALRFGDQATSKDRRLFTWSEDASGVGSHGWRQIIGYYRMSMYGTTLDPNTNPIYNTRILADNTTQGVLQGDMYVDSQSLGLWVSNGVNWEQVNIDTQSFTGNGVPTLTKRPANITGFQADLLTGDLYVDTATDKIYYWNGATWLALTSEDTHSLTGSGDPTVVNPVTTRPDGSALLAGDQYLDTSNFTLYGRDATNTGWVIISDDTHSILGNTDPGAGTLRADGTNPRIGDNYVNTSTGVLWYYDGASWNPVSTDTHSFTGTVNPTDPGSLVNVGNRPNGETLVAGDQYINTTTDALFYWNGTAWDTLSTTDTHSFFGISSNPQGTVTTRPDGSPLLSGDQYFDTFNRGEYVYNATVGKWEYVQGAFVDRQSGTPYISSPVVGSSPTISRDANTPLRPNDLYIDSDVGVLFAYDGGDWIPISEDTHSFTGSGLPTATTPYSAGFRDVNSRYPLVAGDQYIDTATDKIYYWNGSAWESLSAADTHSFTGTVNPNVAGSLVDAGNRPDGSSLVPGDQYYNTVTNVLWVYEWPAGWIVPSGTETWTGNGTPFLVNPFAGTNPQPTRPDGSPLQEADQYIDVGITGFQIYYYYGGDWVEDEYFYGTIQAGNGDPNGVITTRVNGTSLRFSDQYIDVNTSDLYHWSSPNWVKISSADTHSFFGNVHPTDVTSPVAGNVRPDGSALLQGDMYVDNLRREIFVWAGAAWRLYSGTQYYQNPTAPTVRTNSIDAFLEGDVWWNSTIDRHYVRTNANSWKPYGPHTFVQNTTPPVADTYERDLWVDTTDMTMYVYYNDGTSTQWAPIA